MSQLDFYKIKSQEAAAQIIAGRLEQLASQGKTILCLVPGGSAAEVAVTALNELSSPRRVCVTLTDERYGSPGHSDSNWQLLKQLGFDENEFNVFEVLKGISLDQTSAEFNEFLTSARKNFAYVVALLGMGADGHTSGILPGSVAATSASSAESYKAADYTRITTTASFLTSLDEAFVYAVGQDKHSQIELLKTNMPITEQPIQLIKKIERVAFFNDFKGVQL